MNRGEKDELLIKLKLIELKKRQIKTSEFGLISSVGFEMEYGEDFNDLHSLELENEIFLIKLTDKLGIRKAKSKSKADTFINGIPISLKSNFGSPPAIVNHTTRPGFEFVAENSEGKIEDLDIIIDQYWELRMSGQIGEDIANSDHRSPFLYFKDELTPFINYFLFQGSGGGLSEIQADKILSFDDPFDINTWKVYDKSNAIDLFWNKLIFSLRAKKGMPNGYPDNLSKNMLSKKESIARWTNFINGEYRGALHIRTK